MLEAEKEIKSISIIIPVFNEEKNIPDLLRRCLESCEKTGKKYEIVLIDDGSSDGSSELLQKAAQERPGKIVACFLNRNYGQHSAIMAGFSQAEGDLIITLDADLQNPPEEFPRLVQEAEKGFDVVGTVRVNRKDSFLRTIPSAIVNRMAQKATGVMMHDYGCMLRAYKKHIVEAMLMCHERSTFIPILGNSFARRTTEIPVGHSERASGESKYSFWKLINLEFNMMTCMTTFPLRLLSILGTIISGIGILFGIFILVMRCVKGPEWAAQGVFTLFALSFILSGFQMIGMGLMGEYIGRIYHDVRARPRYFIQKVVGKNAVVKEQI